LYFYKFTKNVISATIRLNTFKIVVKLYFFEIQTISFIFADTRFLKRKKIDISTVMKYSFFYNRNILPYAIKSTVDDVMKVHATPTSDGP